MINLERLTCPHCNAPININDGQKKAICEYCGSSLIIDIDSEKTIRIIDETEIKRTEAEKEVKVKEIEYALEQEKNVASISKYLVIGWIAAIVLFFILGSTGIIENGYGIAVLLGIVGFLVWNSSRKKASQKREGEKSRDKGWVCVPSFFVIDKDYKVLRAEVAAAGFTNIECISMKDLLVRIGNREGKVDSLTIGGKTSYSAAGEWVPPDTKVVISYHVLKWG